MVEKEALTAVAQFVENKIETIQFRLSQVVESLSSEAKSTAGDKHQTGRAMLQLEREKLGKQLSENEALIQTVLKLQQRTPSSDQVTLGNLVETDQLTFLLSISAGQLKNWKRGFLCYFCTITHRKSHAWKKSG